MLGCACFRKEERIEEREAKRRAARFFVVRPLVFVPSALAAPAADAATSKSGAPEGPVCCASSCSLCLCAAIGIYFVFSFLLAPGSFYSCVFDTSSAPANGPTSVTERPLPPPSTPGLSTRGDSKPAAVRFASYQPPAPPPVQRPARRHTNLVLQKGYPPPTTTCPRCCSYGVRCSPSASASLPAIPVPPPSAPGSSSHSAMYVRQANSLVRVPSSATASSATGIRCSGLAATHTLLSVPLPPAPPPQPAAVPNPSPVEPQAKPPKLSYSFTRPPPPPVVRPSRRGRGRAFPTTWYPSRGGRRPSFLAAAEAARAAAIHFRGSRIRGQGHRGRGRGRGNGRAGFLPVRNMTLRRENGMLPCGRCATYVFFIGKPVLTPVLDRSRFAISRHKMRRLAASTSSLQQSGGSDGSQRGATVGQRAAVAAARNSATYVNLLNFEYLICFSL
jgi:hypothetical protein